jgi:hypothetical protein
MKKLMCECDECENEAGWMILHRNDVNTVANTLTGMKAL